MGGEGGATCPQLGVQTPLPANDRHIAKVIIAVDQARNHVATSKHGLIDYSGSPTKFKGTVSREF
jgi:hypothetical protein